MPVITAAIDPITRIEGHLKMEVKIDTVNGVQQVVDAFAQGTLFRGFEKILEGRDPRDACLITSRICGVCPTSHALAASLALDAACGVSGQTPARAASRLMRNLTHGACYIESSILHFYLLSLPDYITGLPMAPWLPGWDAGKRIDAGTRSRFAGNFVAAIAARRNAHEMGAIYGGKLPHTPAFIAGGFTAISSQADKDAFGTYLNDLITFIETRYIPDTELLTNLHTEYLYQGKGYGNLISFGVFEQDDTGAPMQLLKRGRIDSATPTTVQTVDVNSITEQIRYSWYGGTDDQNPSVEDTIPQHPKTDAYSWLKAPRYASNAYEAGPLARMIINGDYTNGISVMDRHMARAQEARKIALAMRNWVNDLQVNQPAFTSYVFPTAATSIGLTEAPRGALGHWLQIAAGRTGKYQVVTPTCWNVSPKDSSGKRGPLEQALIGLPVANVDKPIEVLRVVHSYDPCLDCATHVTRVEPGAKVFALGSLPDKA